MAEMKYFLFFRRRFKVFRMRKFLRGGDYCCDAAEGRDEKARKAPGKSGEGVFGLIHPEKEEDYDGS